MANLLQASHEEEVSVSAVALDIFNIAASILSLGALSASAKVLNAVGAGERAIPQLARFGSKVAVLATGVDYGTFVLMGGEIYAQIDAIMHEGGLPSGERIKRVVEVLRNAAVQGLLMAATHAAQKGGEAVGKRLVETKPHTPQQKKSAPVVKEPTPIEHKVTETPNEATLVEKKRVVEKEIFPELAEDVPLHHGDERAQKRALADKLEEMTGEKITRDLDDIPIEKLEEVYATVEAQVTEAKVAAAHVEALNEMGINVQGADQMGRDRIDFTSRELEPILDAMQRLPEKMQQSVKHIARKNYRDPRMKGGFSPGRAHIGFGEAAYMTPKAGKSKIKTTSELAQIHELPANDVMWTTSHETTHGYEDVNPASFDKLADSVGRKTYESKNAVVKAFAKALRESGVPVPEVKKGFLGLGADKYEQFAKKQIDLLDLERGKSWTERRVLKAGDKLFLCESSFVSETGFISFDKNAVLEKPLAFDKEGFASGKEAPARQAEVLELTQPNARARARRLGTWTSARGDGARPRRMARCGRGDPRARPRRGRGAARPGARRGGDRDRHRRDRPRHWRAARRSAGRGARRGAAKW